jgi:hypothetical protein
MDKPEFDFNREESDEDSVGNMDDEIGGGIKRDSNFLNDYKMITNQTPK